MNDKNDIEIFKKSTNNVIRETIQNLAEGLTGIAASDRKELVLSIGHIFQRIRSGQLLTAFLKEWEKYRDSGKIKEDYQRTDQHNACLSELLEYLDRGIPDDQIFSVIKKIFIVSATESYSTR